MEIWDLYDREGKKTGRTWERSHGGGKGIPDGYYHMVVDILVQHVDGTFLLTKRDMNYFVEGLQGSGNSSNRCLPG